MNSSIDDLSLERDDCLRCACRSLNRASERGAGHLGVVRRSGFAHFFFLSPLPPLLSLVMQHISIRVSPRSPELEIKISL